MRTDENVARDSFRFSPQWRENAALGGETPEADRRLRGGELVGGKFVAHSLSGNERNHLFLSSRGKVFHDVSTISGLDTPADSRGFVLFDYDQDGWQDIAVVNANEPLLSLYRNNVGQIRAADSGGGRMVALRFVGGNRSSGPSAFACRDGYGAMVTVALGDATLKREHRCGEGYATQNSATMIVGIGARERVPQVTVRWPSGSNFTVEDVAAGTLLTAYENPADSPTGSPFVRRPYVSASAPSAAMSVDPSSRRRPWRFAISGVGSAPGEAQPELFVYTTMASWCAACKRHLPQLAHLRASLGDGSIGLIGIPIDEKDDEATLRAYVEEWRPAYRLLAEMAPEQRLGVKKFLAAKTGLVALPSSIVTDRTGTVLEAVAGVPTVSRLRQILAALAAAPQTPARPAVDPVRTDT